MRTVFTTTKRDEAEHFADSIERQGITARILVSRAVGSLERKFSVLVLSESDAEAVTR